MNIYRSPSHYLLIGLTLLSIAVYALVESSKSPKAQPYLKQKTEATRLASLAQNALKERIVELGIPIDKENDPAETGLIGEQYTLITTDTGVLHGVGANYRHLHRCFVMGREQSGFHLVGYGVRALSERADPLPF